MNKKNSVFRHFSPNAEQSMTQVAHLSFNVNTCFRVYIGPYFRVYYFLLFYAFQRAEYLRKPGLHVLLINLAMKFKKYVRYFFATC